MPTYFTYQECIDGYWDNLDADHTDAGQRTVEYLCAVSSSPEPPVQVEVINPPAPYQPPSAATSGGDTLVMGVGFGVVVVMLAILIGLQIQARLDR